MHSTCMCLNVSNVFMYDKSFVYKVGDLTYSLISLFAVYNNALAVIDFGALLLVVSTVISGSIFAAFRIVDNVTYSCSFLFVT